MKRTVVILHMMSWASCIGSDALVSEPMALLVTHPIENCFNNLDDDRDATVDEGCSAFDVPAAVTAYASGETEARLFLNVGKAVAIDGVGVVHETWLKVTHVIDPGNIAAIRGIVMYRRSLDNGVHFSTEQALTIDSDFTGYPKIAAFGNMVYITFHAIYGPGGTPPQPYLIRSTNNGQGFLAIQKLSTAPAAMPTIAAFGPFVHVVWAAGSPSFAEIFIASSLDSGAHFNPPQQISSSDNRSSWTPAVAAWGPRVIVAWTDERHNTVDCQGSSDPGTQCREELYAAVSIDAGQHFGGEQRLTNDGATPHSTWAPSLAMWMDRVHVAYFDRQDDQHFQVYYLRSTTGGTTWEPTRQLSPPFGPTSDVIHNARPSVGVFEDKVHITYWQTHQTGVADVVYTASPNHGDCFSQPITLSRGTAPGEPHPSIAVSPNGWSFLLWYASIAGRNQLFATRRRPVVPICD